MPSYQSALNLWLLHHLTKGSHTVWRMDSNWLFWIRHYFVMNWIFPIRRPPRCYLQSDILPLLVPYSRIWVWILQGVGLLFSRIHLRSGKLDLVATLTYKVLTRRAWTMRELWWALHGDTHLFYSWAFIGLAEEKFPVRHASKPHWAFLFGLSIPVRQLLSYLKHQNTVAWKACAALV